MSGRPVACVALAAMLGAAAARASDWPQLWGPRGDGRAAGALPGAGAPALKARELWRRPIGSGFSGVSVVGTRGFTAHSDGARDQVIAFDAATGRELWRADLGETYRGHDGSRDGPISTPTVDGERVYVVGPHGLLVALDGASGRRLWAHDLPAEFGAAKPVYGFATSPLVAAGRVIVQAGGEKQHHVLAFEGSSGRLAWSAHHGSGPAYVTPVLATLHGVPQVLTVSADKVLALDPASGALLWSHGRPSEHEPSRPPLVLPDGRVLVHSWTESALLAVARSDGAFAVSEVWRRPVLRGSYSPTVHHGGHLYGFNGAYLVCVDPANGEVKWRQKVYGGSLILVGDDLVLLAETAGDVRVVEATPSGYREKLKAAVFNPGATCSTGPTWARGRLFLRNVEEMVALEIGA